MMDLTPELSAELVTEAVRCAMVPRKKKPWEWVGKRWITGPRMASKHKQAFSVDLLSDDASRQMSDAQLDQYFTEGMRRIAHNIGYYVGPRIKQGLLQFGVFEVERGIELRASWWSREPHVCGDPANPEPGWWRG